LLIESSSQAALATLRKQQDDIAKDHFYSSNTQSAAIKTINENISKHNIRTWSTLTNTIPQHIYQFARKALLQQLPTAANLHKWKKIANPDCVLCNANNTQTNKHVLSNCPAKIALERYTHRHDNVLSMLADWIAGVKSPIQQLFADIAPDRWNPIESVFKPSCRPDLLLVDGNKIGVLELTVCHETNLAKSKLYKLNKYKHIGHSLQPNFSICDVQIFTIEISTLGFISDFKHFQSAMALPPFTMTLHNAIINSVLNDSYNIYKLRNTI